MLNRAIMPNILLTHLKYRPHIYWLDINYYIAKKSYLEGLAENNNEALAYERICADLYLKP